MTELIVEVGEVYSYIKPNANVKLNLEFIDKNCSFEVLGAKYTEKYKSGEWDGRYHLFDKVRMRFPTGLLDIVLDCLLVDCYEYDLKYLYKQPTINDLNISVSEIDFRDYQILCINKSFEKKHGIINTSTGSGKTITAIGIIEKFKVKTLFLVHTRDLLYQTYNQFKNFIKGASIGIIGDGNLEIGDITVATIQTLSSKLEDTTDSHGDFDFDKFEDYGDDEPIIVKLKPTEINKEVVKNLLNNCKLVICDECHHIPSRLFYRVMMKTNAVYRFGLSATPFRDDGFDMKITAGLGSEICKIMATELIEKGYLAKPHIKFLNTYPKTYPKKATFTQVYKDYIVDNDIRNQIIKIVAEEQVNKGKQTLILVKQVRHLNVLANLIPNSVIISGEMSGDERQDILKRFKIGDIKLLIGTTIADEGLDLPCIECLILGGSGKSRSKALQRIGRAIRLFDICPNCESYDVLIKSIHDDCICRKCGNKWKYKGKTDVVIYDFKDNTKKWLFDHYLLRKTIYETEKAFEITFREIKFSQ